MSADPSNQPYQAAFNVCPVVDLMKALLEKAGKNLNYGTLATAIDGLKVTVSGDPTPRVFSPTELDGNANAYLFNWDPATKTYVAAQELGAHEAASRAPAHPVDNGVEMAQLLRAVPEPASE